MQPTIEIARTTDHRPLGIIARMANRHGLIAGATGTGKTVTLQTLAEGFSRQGVAVFAADVKGDLSGLAAAGDRAKVEKRLTTLGITDFSPRQAPVVFWDIFAKSGHPIRTTVSEMGPVLLARLLSLNDTQQAVLELGFRVADEQGLLLLDLKDLHALLSWVGEHATELREQFGNVSPATIGAIQRNVLNLSESGGDRLFGEPALKLEHLLQRDFSGNGVISIFDATWLLSNPRLYATFLLSLLSELFEELPEAGDLDRPKLVFFFDEAHLLFQDQSPALLEKIEQMVRLIRSKGVGVYFVTQNPLDIPERVLGQLGNRVQHALRAFTPADQKAVKTAAQTFRPNPAIDTATAITELAIGEALVSTLDDQGSPTPVERALIVPPSSRIGPLSPEERSSMVQRSPLKGVYDELIDRESAFELLKARREAQPAANGAASSQTTQESTSFFSRVGEFMSPSGKRQGFGEAIVKSVLRSVGSNIGRQIARGLLGSMTGSKR